MASSTTGWLSMGVISTPLRMLYTDGAVLMAMTHVLLPFMVLPIATALRSIPDDLARPALKPGASRWSVFPPCDPCRSACLASSPAA